MLVPRRRQLAPKNIAERLQYFLATLLTATLVFGCPSKAANAEIPARDVAAEAQAVIAKAAKLPLKDAAYFLWQERMNLDTLEGRPMTDEERAEARARTMDQVAAMIRYEHDHAQDGKTFERLKRAHPKAHDAEAKKAIIAGVKFNDDCFKYFPTQPADFDRRIDHAIALARKDNPGYLESTYRLARYWVMFYMK
jgi:hypothetical protein